MEIGLKEETPHYHLYIALKNSVYGRSVAELLGNSHVEKRLGTPEQARDYVFKTGKWAGDPKEDTRIEGKQYQYGKLPAGRGARSDLHLLKKMLLNGKSNAEIYEESAEYMRYSSSLDRIRQDLMMNKFRTTWRDLRVTYIFGATGTGKTRGVMEEYGYDKVYRVTDYNHPFDSYSGQDVIVFEEFRSGNKHIKISDMLNYLDGYPVALPPGDGMGFTVFSVNIHWVLVETG
ncbi:MAG: hypothetical protein GXY32_00360 [Ruminococcaceae bacterium]|nr:hypothetical protein [Oscillospiraceae bacterium]